MQDRSLAVLDVGHGNSAVLIDDHGTLVIDAGSKNHLLEYLVENAISHVDIVLISHADQDHIAGLLALLGSDISIGRVRLNSDAEKGSKLWDDLLYELDHQDRTGGIDFALQLVSDSGEEFSCGRVQVEVLGPSKYLAGKGPGSKDKDGRKITTNSISAVIKLSVDDCPIALFAGDLDSVGMADLQRRGVCLSAVTLIFPHHGGRAGASDMELFTEKLLGAVLPTNVVFSIGRGRYKTPRIDVVNTLRQKLPNTRMLCTQLSEHCSDKKVEAAPQYLDAVYSGGKEYGHCCAGTVLIDVETGDLISPQSLEHAGFISKYVASALCQ